MTAREFFNYMDSKGLADINVRVRYRDESLLFNGGDNLGEKDDGLGFGIEVTVEEWGTVIYV